MKSPLTRLGNTIVPLAIGVVMGAAVLAWTLPLDPPSGTPRPYVPVEPQDQQTFAYDLKCNIPPAPVASPIISAKTSRKSSCVCSDRKNTAPIFLGDVGVTLSGSVAGVTLRAGECHCTRGAGPTFWCVAPSQQLLHRGELGE